MQPFEPPNFPNLYRVAAPDEALDETLQRVSDLALAEVEDCDIAGITLLRDGNPATAVYTDPRTPHIDAAQYETGGPCLDAFHHSLVYRIEDTETDPRWPAFGAGAAAAGIRSTLSLPLVVGETALGALNLYSRRRAGFTDDASAMVFAAQAAVVLANSQAYWAAHHLAAQLELALTSRAVIEQAKGIMMARHRCGAEEAFELLRRASNETNRKLRDVAADLIDDVDGGESEA
jgi:GAF domain-containing protein